ncbi:bactofilin family protein [Methylocystis sp. JAN1]|uniref:bactofilin family protein n=1 Tax=Methylocystis sp. JAN1 TaxID=3397211 RepID=UPI003FA250E3
MATFRPDEENAVYIGHGAEMTGAIRARDSIVIDGTFDGEISCNHLLVGPSGVVKGRVNVSSADIAGQVSAEIVTKHLLSVRATGRVEGKWDCGTIEVARGAVLNGAAHVAQSAGAARREPVAEAHSIIETDYVEEEEYEAPAPALVAPPREAPRLTKLNLRTPLRRKVG